MKGRRIERKDLKVGMAVIAQSCAASHGMCWSQPGKGFQPFKITLITLDPYNIYLSTLDNVPIGGCNDKTVSLYLWEEEKTWDGLAKGDLIQESSGNILRVVERLGEIIWYCLQDEEPMGGTICIESLSWLKENATLIQSPPETTEVLGKKYNASDVREAVKGLKEVE